MKLTPESYDDLPTRRRTLSRVLIGPAKDLRDPHLFHSLSLVAFLAWVGLGSDGLSSSCYGPEEAFLALGTHQYLAVFLALLMALTVFVISASYSQTIDSFSAGGGGYLVATKLLGTYPGLVSGCALIVDYVLTIAISIASGADAILSFLPAEWLPAKFFVAIAVVVLMVAMNLRGVKGSVLALVPVFLAFVGLHVIFVSVGEVDASLLKGQEEVDQLERQIADDMYEYCQTGGGSRFPRRSQIWNRGGCSDGTATVVPRGRLDISAGGVLCWSVWSSMKRSTDSSAGFSTTIPRSICFDGCNCMV